MRRVLFTFSVIIILIIIVGRVKEKQKGDSPNPVNQQITESSYPVATISRQDIDALGIELHREQSGKPYHVFFHTKFVETDSLYRVVRYYKDRNTSHTFRILFFDEVPKGVYLGYPLEDRLSAHWIAEYIYVRHKGLDSLYLH